MKRKGYKRKLWTAQDDAVMQTMFADNYTADICALLGRTYSSVTGRAAVLGIKKSEAFLKMELSKQANRLRIVGAAHRYAPGHVSDNKGQKMAPDVYAKVKATMFKKGDMPHNAVEDGYEAIRTDKNGKQYWKIKVPGKAWMIHKHAWLWEEAHGPVEKGMNVVFKDGNTLNCVLDNLEIISDGELMRRNTFARFPEELKNTIRLFNKLKRKINGKEQN